MSSDKQPDPPETGDPNLILRRQIAELLTEVSGAHGSAVSVGQFEMLLDAVDPELSGDASVQIESVWVQLSERSRNYRPDVGLGNRDLPAVLITPDGRCYLVRSIRGGVPQVRVDSDLDAPLPADVGECRALIFETGESARVIGQALSPRSIPVTGSGSRLGPLARCTGTWSSPRSSVSWAWCRRFTRCRSTTGSSDGRSRLYLSSRWESLYRSLWRRSGAAQVLPRAAVL